MENYEPLIWIIIIGILTLIGITFLYAFHKQLKEYAAIISAIAASMSATTALITYNFSRQILNPVERPILSLTDQTIKKGELGEYMLTSVFKNIGKHPATEIRSRGGWAPRANISSFEKIPEQVSANVQDPESTNSTATIFAPIGRVEGEVVYIYYQMRYRDDDSPNAVFCREFWFKYELGNIRAYHLDLAEKQVFEPQVVKAYGKEKERCELSP